MDAQATGAAPSSSLARALQRSLEQQTGQAVAVKETHISWVLLTVQLAYKLKKPVRLPFLDFGSIAARKHWCEEELRLNRRTAPGLYLSVLPVRGAADAPRIAGEGPVIDYVVCMRRFPSGALFGEMLAAGTLQPVHVDQLAHRLAEFHLDAPMAAAGTPCVEPQTPVASVLASLEAAYGAVRITPLRAWIEAQAPSQHAVWMARRGEGAVRECHGDLHLDNVVWLDGEAVPFDAIEFDPGLRWIDVMSDVAFMTMDLQARDRTDLAYRFLDAYLQCTGDYDGLAVLRYYEVYRAAVRSMVGTLGRNTVGEPQPDYLGCAQRLMQGPSGGPRLLITCGVSGSGKSTVATQLVSAAAAIRLRSDVERKRLFGLRSLQRPASESASLYSTEATRCTYGRLADCAREVLHHGYPVIVDAAFLRRAERLAFKALADEMHVPFAILHCHAGEETLRRRVAARHASNLDASDADGGVLQRQLEYQEALDDEERRFVIDVATNESVDLAAVLARWLGSGLGTLDHDLSR